MRFDKNKQCFVNDDGSKLESSESILQWSDMKYITWLQKGVAASGRQSRDNTHLWPNSIKYSTRWGRP